MTSYAVYQPHLGWPLYVLHRAVHADTFVLLNDVELSKAGLNRLTVPTAQDVTHITMPLAGAGSSSIIQQVRPVNLQDWLKKAEKTLQNLYGRRAGWLELREAWTAHWKYTNMEEHGDENHWTLDNIACWSLVFLLEQLKPRPRGTPVIRFASTLIPREEEPEASIRLARIGELLKASTYVTGGRAANEYLAALPFARRGIDVQVQRWEMKPYESLHGEQQWAGMSSFDLLFSQGTKKAREVLGLSE